MFSPVKRVSGRGGGGGVSEERGGVKEKQFLKYAKVFQEKKCLVELKSFLHSYAFMGDVFRTILFSFFCFPCPYISFFI